MRYVSLISTRAEGTGDLVCGMALESSASSRLEETEAQLVEDLKALLKSGSGKQEELERLQIKLSMIHEAQTQAAHLAFEDLKQEPLVAAEEVIKNGRRKPRRMRISFEEMPIVWPLGVKERFIRKMVGYDHSTGGYIMNFFGEGVVEASGVRLILEKSEAEKVCGLYLKYADKLAASLDLSVVK